MRFDQDNTTRWREGHPEVVGLMEVVVSVETDEAQDHSSQHSQRQALEERLHNT